LRVLSRDPKPNKVTKMKITKDSVASFHYTLTDEAGIELETSRDSQPTVYLHGHKGILPALEAHLADKASGDVIQAILGPEEAYGAKQEESITRVPVKHLIYNGKLRPGMAVHLNTSKGRQPVTIAKVGRHSADIDTNHPLAGKTLQFDIEIVEVRAATVDELSHGHAHGPGGHQH
jgi:FKBP-type peptidyl-prolyl cis-trans isomerase SlyD